MKEDPSEFYRNEIKKISEIIGSEKCNSLIVDFVFNNMLYIERLVLNYLIEYLEEQENDRNKDTHKTCK